MPSRIVFLAMAKFITELHTQKKIIREHYKYVTKLKKTVLKTIAGTPAWFNLIVLMCCPGAVIWARLSITSLIVQHPY